MNKINKITTRAIAIALVCACFAGKSIAQSTSVLPINFDQLFYTSAQPLSGLNTAMIAYGSTLSPGSLVASVYKDGTIPGTTIHLFDYNTSSPGGGTGTLNTTVASVPDVVIGNWDGSSGTGSGGYCAGGCNVATDFLTAAAYVNGSGDVEVDFFHVNDPGTGGGTSIGATLITYTVISAGTYHPQNVHIDVIADYGNTLPTGFAFCNNFTLTFDDFTTAGSPNIYIAEGNLNTQTVGIATSVNPTGVNGFAPDVAGVQRMGGGIHDVALLTYADVSGNMLYYQEYNFATATAGSLITLDAGSTSTNIINPRIDAFDDYSHYNSLRSNYTVVAQALNSTTGNNEVRAYDDVYSAFTSSGVIDLTTSPGYPGYPAAATYNSYAPTVACTPHSLYFVSHFTDYGLSAPTDALFMEPIPTSSNSLAFGNYYWVNGVRTLCCGGSSYAPPAGIDGYNTYANAVATAPNYMAVWPVYTWVQHVAATPAYQVYYKIPAPGVFDFKPAPSSVATVAEQDWQLYPNPTADELGVVLEPGAATAYSITDMTGRELRKGTITGTSATISTGTLAAGTYLLQLYKESADAGKKLFVKE